MAASDRDLIQVAFHLSEVSKKSIVEKWDSKKFRFIEWEGVVMAALQLFNETRHIGIKGGVMKKETSK